MKAKTPVLTAVLLLLAMLGVSFAQKDKKWTEWSKKDADKMLNDSPWAKTQTDTDSREGFFTPTSAPGVNGARETSNDSSRASQGATNQSTSVSYIVRFYSARPIRQALARNVWLNQKEPDAATVQGLQRFGEVKSPDSIIVTVSFKGAAGSDSRSVNPVMQAFNSATTGTLKNNVYLQRNDGKQLFLQEYIPPGKDGFGARFIFLRMPEEKLFIDSNTKEIRFYAEFSSSIKIDRRFKTADMMYEGELEY